MAPRERTWTWEWWFDAPPSRVWPLVSDTDRVDRLAGLPPASYGAAPPAEGDGALAVEQRYGLLPTAAYVESPYEWVEDERFAVERVFSKGPVTRMTLDTRLAPDGRGTRVVTRIGLVPRSRLWSWVVSAIVRRAKRGQDRAYEDLRREAAEDPPDRPARRAVLRRALARCAGAGDAVPPDLASLLSTHVATADAADLARIRPFALADAWKCPRQDVLAAALGAVRAGVLELSWDSLCPHCRGARRSAPSLVEVRSRASCEACGIDFELDFDRSLEAVFRPAPDLRRVSGERYCVGGPGTTPHVLAQARVPAGGESEVVVRLEPGSYRVRCARRPAAAALRVDDAPGALAESALRVEVGPRGPTLSPDAVPAGPARFQFANPGPMATAALVERTRWLDDVATAMDVLSVPGFSDLFTSEVLAPGERIAVRGVAILFTDLKDSTALYRRVGDAAAYAVVRDHYRVLREAIRGRGGFLVKTIGDAVMASFRTAADALRAAVEMHRGVAALPAPDGAQRLVLKAGLHRGPSIAVEAGGRIDFFGTTTNLAARAQHESEGGDVVATDEVVADEDAAAFLASVPHREETFAAALKGFEQPVRLHRIRL